MNTKWIDCVGQDRDNKTKDKTRETPAPSILVTLKLVRNDRAKREPSDTRREAFQSLF
jgi:hypothetical protein